MCHHVLSLHDLVTSSHLQSCFELANMEQDSRSGFTYMQDLQKRYMAMQHDTTEVHAKSLVTLAHSVHMGLGVVATIQQWAETSHAIKMKSDTVCNSPK